MKDAPRLDDIRQVTFGLDDHEHPVFSPDGRKVAFYAGAYGHINLFVADADGRNLRPLTAARGNHTQAFWSPDEAFVYYRAQPDPATPWSIWRARADDPRERQCLLTDRRAHFKHPAVSPDGRCLAWFSDEGSPGTFHLFKAPLTPRGPGRRTRLTDDPDRNDCHPTWSPDGRFLVFHAYMGREDASTCHIHVIRADGAGLRRLTTEGTLHKHPFFVGRDLIVHHSEGEDGRRHLALRSVRTGELLGRLTSGRKDDKHPSPFVPRRGPARIVFASKKRGPELGPDAVATWDIFHGALEGIRVRR